MAELLALASALCFGVTHFVNGLVARRHHGVTVAAYAQLAGTAFSLVLVVVLPAGSPTAAALLWGAVSGLGTGVGVAFLYRAMGRGPISVVVPISDVGAVAIPVLVGLTLLGDRLSVPALIGVAAALPAIWLVSGGAGLSSPGTADAVIAGIGFAVQFLAMGQVAADTGLWPTALSRIVSVLVVVVLVAAVHAPRALPFTPSLATLGAGTLGTLAIVLYLYATQQQLLTIAVVLSALYPAIPVLLGLFVLRERITRQQTVGLAAAALAIALISLR